MWISTSASSALSVWALYLKFFAFQVKISFVCKTVATSKQSYILGRAGASQGLTEQFYVLKITDRETETK